MILTLPSRCPPTNFRAMTISISFDSAAAAGPFEASSRPLPRCRARNARTIPNVPPTKGMPVNFTETEPWEN